jgi:hypothetical protein
MAVRCRAGGFRPVNSPLFIDCHSAPRANRLCAFEARPAEPRRRSTNVSSDQGLEGSVASAIHTTTFV